MITYQDYKAEPEGKIAEFVQRVIREHQSSRDYKTALTADEYDAERNITIRDFMRVIYSGTGAPMEDETASNLRITSNFFHILNKQRCNYSLGNGLTFQAEGVKEKLGPGADKAVKDAAYAGLIHGVSFIYWAYDHIHLFRLTEFAPLWDEETSDLGAGVRFWQLAADKPLHATLYAPDGYMDFKADSGSSAGLEPVDGIMRPYRMTVATTPATDGAVLTAHNYSRLPIVPLWGSELRQSTLVGMRSKIDTYDIVQSGLANDIQDCASVYWLVSGAGGVTEQELSKFRQRLIYRHFAEIDGNNVTITPYTQEIPHEARKVLLDTLRARIYEDFCALDVDGISGRSGAKTATEIRAAYQALDGEADEFEYQVTSAVQKLLALQGVSAEDAEPQYKRNIITNEKEQVEVVLMESPYLDDETILKKLPNISSEEVDAIMQRRTAEETAAYQPEQGEGGDYDV